MSASPKTISKGSPSPPPDDAAESSTSASSSSGMSAAKKLELNLSSRDLSSIPSDLLSEHRDAIVKLDLSDNELTSLSTLIALPKLHTLIIDKNKLSALNDIPTFPALTTLWMNNNHLTNLTAILDALASRTPVLTYLSMLRNPACPDMYFSDGEAEAYQRYRYYVIYRLRSLQFLDATPVTPSERREADEKGKYYAVSRPADTDEDTMPQRVTSPNGNQTKALVGAAAGNGAPPKVATFLAKGKPRYDGTNSEGNRFIVNDDL